MASSLWWSCAPPHSFPLRSTPLPLRFPPPSLPFPTLPAQIPSDCLAVRASERGRVGSQGAPLRRPLEPVEGGGAGEEEEEEEEEGETGRRRGEDWVDWEDQILEDTVPLVGFVRMILHSGKYKSGDRLSPEHEKTILERLLPYHPEFEKKIGPGIDFITTGFHPEFENSRCLFIVRKDGELVDFSYWKCIKGLIKKNYPLYADSFILRHFRRRRQTE